VSARLRSAHVPAEVVCADRITAVAGTGAAGSGTPTNKICLRGGLWFGLRFPLNNTLLFASQEEQRLPLTMNLRRYNSRKNPAAG